MMKISTQVASGKCCGAASYYIGNTCSSAAGRTVTRSSLCRVWCFFGGLEAAASPSALGFFKKECSEEVSADGTYKTSGRAWLGKGVSMDNLSDFSGPCLSTRREWE